MATPLPVPQTAPYARSCCLSISQSSRDDIRPQRRILPLHLQRQLLRLDTMLAAHVAIEMVLATETTRVVFAVRDGAVEALAVGVVLGEVAGEIFAVLEALVAVRADVLAAHVGGVRAHVVRQFALGRAGRVAVVAVNVAG